MKTCTVEELIEKLPETINYKGDKAFLEITSGHVYYCTKHDNKGNLSCVFVSIGMGIKENLLAAIDWLNEQQLHSF